jgi:hypothetical protein
MAKSKQGRNALLTALGTIIAAPVLLAQWLEKNVGVPVPVTLGAVIVVVVWLIFVYLRNGIRDFERFRSRRSTR